MNGITHFSKNFLFDNNETKNTVSFHKSLKNLLWVGRLIGVYPVQYQSSTTSFIPLKNRKVSLAYLFSLLLLILKGTASVQLFLLLFEYKRVYVSKENRTNLMAGTIGFLFMYCFGVFAHIMSIWRLTPFLKCLRSIETYDLNYPRTSLKMDKDWEKSHKIGVWNMISTLFPCVLTICTPTYLLYKTVLSGKLQFDLYLLPGISTDNHILVFAYFAITFLMLELGVGFINLQVFWLVRHLSVRFDYMAHLLEEKASKPELHSILDFKTQQQKSWGQLARQYLDLTDAFNNFQEFSWPYFLILFSTLLVSLVCFLYIVLSGTNIIGDVTNPYAINFVLSILVSRILVLAESGQTVQDKYKRLKIFIMAGSLSQEFMDEEEENQLEALVDLITTTKLYLTSGGFFLVSRKNMTSILSAIITYIVVLFQFRQST